MDYYKQIFKRKSFHIFKDTDTLTSDEIQELKDFIKSVKPLNDEIKTEICIVPEKETFKVQELHLPVYHCLCAMLEEEFF
jgi:predicted AAA+ superfamily ATPase